MDSTSTIGTAGVSLSHRNYAMNAANSDVTADLKQPIDGFTVSATRSAILNTCLEMATYVSRTATAPIVNQSNTHRPPSGMPGGVGRTEYPSLAGICPPPHRTVGTPFTKSAGAARAVFRRPAHFPAFLYQA